MKIAFDARPLFRMRLNTGVGKLTYNWLSSLLKLAPAADLEFHILAYSRYFPQEIATNSRVSLYYADEEFALVEERSPRSAQIIHQAIARFLAQVQPDTCHITSSFPRSTDSYSRRWFPGVSVISTVYDILPSIRPDWYLTSKRLIKSFEDSLEFVRQSDWVLAISQRTRSDLIELAGVDPAHIQVFYPAPSPCFHPRELSSKEIDVLRTKYGLTSPFILSLGRGPRKNLDTLIEAFALLPPRLRDKHQLLIAGQDKCDDLKIRADNLGVGGAVIVAGFVPEADLVDLYRLCRIFAFPSLHEGFGLPIVEAMSCGACVLTSAGSALIEIAGDAALKVVPDKEELSDSLELLLDNKQLRSSFRDRGLKHARKFSWARVAQETIDIYHRLSSVRPVLTQHPPAARYSSKQESSSSKLRPGNSGS